MTRHAGASILLSVLIVVFFAVALYPHKHAAHSAVSARSVAKATNPALPTVRPAPPATPGIPLADPPMDSAPRTAARSAEKVPNRVVETVSANQPRPSRPATFAPVSRPPTVSRATPSAPPRAPAASPRAPRSAFTQSVEGETLVDVAVRVYGSSESAQTLWMVNRDVIDDSQTVLVAGTLLRTP